MRSLIVYLTFVVMALVINLCAATPLTRPDRSISLVAGGLNDTIPLNITGIPGNTSTDDLAPIKIHNTCYHWFTSEKWEDVGGKFSEFVNNSVTDLCRLITFDAYNGFPAGNMARHCMEVPKGTQQRNYDRSIGIVLRYKGSQQTYFNLTAAYCNDLMAKPMLCGAGGQFNLRVDNPDLPSPDHWVAQADPNRGNCTYNGYKSDLSSRA